MDYIVLDIEFNGRKFASELPMEVIEIGAVRLGPTLAPIDEFGAMIKPVYFSKLNSFIRKKTGIVQEEIDRAADFPTVIADFLAWLNRSDTCMLVTWGGEDVKRIVLDTRMHKLDDAYWRAVPCFDLLKGYLRCKGVANDVSVEAALADLGIANDSTAHRALDDARMTAKVLQAIADRLDWTHARPYKDTFSNAKERRLVKNAVRMMAARKTAPSWEQVVEQFLTGKVDLTDPRKAAELETYFQAELVSARTKARANEQRST